MFSLLDKIKFPKAHQDLLNITSCVYRQHVLTPETMVASHFRKLLSSYSLPEASCQHRLLGTICNPLLQKSISTPTQDISLILIPLWAKMHLVYFTTYMQESSSSLNSSPIDFKHAFKLQHGHILPNSARNQNITCCRTISDWKVIY